MICTVGVDGVGVIERNDYLPYGLKLEYADAQSSGNRHQYNSNELQTVGLPESVKYLDYGARIYLPRLGRFTAPDPLSELFFGDTSYNFTLNNPVNMVDLYGLAPIRVPGGTFESETVSWYINPIVCYGKGIGLSYADMMFFRSLQDDFKHNSDEAILARIYAQNPMARVVHNAQNAVINNPIAQTILGAAYGIAISSALSGVKLLGNWGTIAKCSVQTGKTFGKLGTSVNNPGIKIKCVSKHAVEKAISRGVKPTTILNTVRNPTVILQQSSGNYLYLTKEAAVVLNPAGKIVTTYPSSMFDSGILNVLKGF